MPQAGKGIPATTTLGRFLRLAEFGADTPCEELYRQSGGEEAEREVFLQDVVEQGYIEIGGNRAVWITNYGRMVSRSLV